MKGTNWWSTPDGMRFEIKESINVLKIRFKKLHPDSVTPSYAKDGDAGLDLTAVTKSTKSGLSFVEYGTGIAVEIPYGYVGLIFPRSSVSKMEDFYLKNAVGVIDSGYRGEILLRFNKSHTGYDVGDKVGQLIILPYPQIQLEEVAELSDTQRGVGGFGLTGS